MNVADLSIFNLEQSHFLSEISFMRGLCAFSFIMVCALVVLLIMADLEVRK